LIEIHHITKTFGQQTALSDVSFHVAKGEIVGLLGPNGAGKSTLMKILTCFIPPTEGEASICGHSIYDDTLAVRRSIGYLPELNPLYPDMYVREYLRFAAGLSNAQSKTANLRARVDEMIELTGLAPEAHKKIGQLSKGYRQRVGLAQALVHDPDVLILDEPTTGLDPNQLEFIRALIRNAGQSKAVLLSTHIMQEVEAMCTRAIVINHGRIVADESTHGINANKLTEQFHKLTESENV
jgi:ABC-2 type transport system ATP-binding protein